MKNNKGAEIVQIILSDEEKEKYVNNNRTVPDLSRLIQTDKDGKKYFNVPNIHTQVGNVGCLFSYHIKDAIDEIKNGIGHVISDDRLWNQSIIPPIHVRHYLDREYGEFLKKKTLEGWKDAKFCYAIVIYNRHSWSNGYFLDDNFDFYYPNNDGVGYQQFDSYEEAIKVANSLEEESKRFWEELNSIDIDKFSDVYDDISSKYHKVVVNSSEDGLKCYHNRKPIPEGENPWIIRVVQDVKIKK